MIENKFPTVPKAGEKYKHFKGGIYEVIAVAQNTETDDLVVVYEGTSGIWARPLFMFMQMVIPPNTKTPVPRFTKIENTVDFQEAKARAKGEHNIHTLIKELYERKGEFCFVSAVAVTPDGDIGVYWSTNQYSQIAALGALDIAKEYLMLDMRKGD